MLPQCLAYARWPFKSSQERREIALRSPSCAFTPEPKRGRLPLRRELESDVTENCELSLASRCYQKETTKNDRGGERKKTVFVKNE